MLTWLNWLANNRFADTNKNVDSPSDDGEFSFKMGMVKIHKNKRKKERGRRFYEEYKGKPPFSILAFDLMF